MVKRAQSAWDLLSSGNSAVPNGRTQTGIHPGPRQLQVADQFDALLFQRQADARVAQSSQFSFALGRVSAEKVRINVTGVTAQFGHARADFLLEDALQIFRADLFEMCLAAPLTIKIREIANR